MDPNSLTDFQRIINTQVYRQEALLEYHFKIEAMLEVLLASNLIRHPAVTMHNFLWGLSDMIQEARALNEESLNSLLKAITLIDPSGSTTLH